MCMSLVCTLFAPHTTLAQWLGGGQHPLMFLAGSDFTGSSMYRPSTPASCPGPQAAQGKAVSGAHPWTLGIAQA